MSLSDIVVPRPEVLRKEGVEGVIDVENIRDPKKKSLESRPDDFLELTWPTADIRLVLEHLDRRFNSNEKSAGLFLLEGYKGSGKSHLELLVHHLFANPDPANKWLAKHDLVCRIPREAVVCLHKFTDFPLESIWSLVFSKLGFKQRLSPERVPNLDELREALNGRHLILILDELEMGIQSMAKDHVRAQNLAFLQMLSEESLRTENASVTIFASVYDSNREPGATLKRVPRIDVKFADPHDRQRVILHRLFANYLELDRNRVNVVVQSYLNVWRDRNISVDERYVERLQEAFPFSPELLQMILFNVPSGRGFQGSRGALGLLGALVRNAHKKTDLITTAHLDLNDAGIRNRLSDLDPTQHLLQCAQSDLRDLGELPLAPQIIASAFIATVAPSGHVPGIGEQELARQVIAPGGDINQYHATLNALLKLGTYFQSQEGNFYFDEQEKPNAKVEYRSLRVDPSTALNYALVHWATQLFGDSTAIVFREVAQVQADLARREPRSLRFVLSPRRLTADERIGIYHGAENRNQIILLEPKADTFNGLDHPDITKWAQRVKAAEELLQTASDAERRKQYDKIAREDRNYILDAFKKAGLAFVWMQADGQAAEIEPLGTAVTCDEVKRQLRENFFPRQRFEEHLAGRGEQIIGKTVREIDAEYRKTLGFPVRTADSTIIDAIKALCLNRQIGLRHERGSACGSSPDYSAMEWWDARVDEPFEDPKLSAFVFDARTAEGGEPRAEGREPELHTFSPQPSALHSIQTSFAKTLGALRQEVAAKLNEYENPKIRRAQFMVYASQENVALDSVSESLRGKLTGSGSLIIDLTISKAGEFSKGQIEQMIEQLPYFAGAQYKADLKVEI